MNKTPTGSFSLSCLLYCDIIQILYNSPDAYNPVVLADPQNPTMVTLQKKRHGNNVAPYPHPSENLRVKQTVPSRYQEMKQITVWKGQD